MKSRIHRIVGRAFLAGLALLTSVAVGQPGGGFGGPDGAFGPPVSGRDLDVYKEVLRLTPDQEEAAQVLMEGYQESYRVAAQEMRDRMRAARESGGNGRDGSQWEEMRKGFEELRESRAKSEAAFKADLQSVLTPEQAELWPKAEREVRREKTLGRGLLSGEAVDVSDIAKNVVDSLPEGERATVMEAVAPTLEQYAQDLDRELVARNEMFESGMRRGGELMAQGDMEGVQALFEKGREASDRVREINLRYARQIEGLLPEASRAAFDLAVQKASFPEVYRETYASRAVAAAAAIPSLDESQREGVKAIAETYNRNLARSNEEMTAAILEREKNMTVQDMFQGRGGRRGGGNDEIRQSRRELETTTLESLKKILTPEQFAALPSREDRQDGGGRGRNNRDGRDAPGGDDAVDRPRRRSF